MRKQLTSAISFAVRSGLVLEDNPLGESGIKPRTCRLSHQSPVVTRRTRAPVPRAAAAVETRHGDGVAGDLFVLSESPPRTGCSAYRSHIPDIDVGCRRS